MVAKGFINLLHIRLAYNLADTLSKHWSYQSNYENLTKPLLNFYDYKTPAGAKGTNATIKRLCVTDLIEYEAEGSDEDEELEAL